LPNSAKPAAIAAASAHPFGNTAGSENAVALVKSAVAAASNAFESVQKAAKQAAEVADANFHALSTTAGRAAKVKRAA